MPRPCCPVRPERRARGSQAKAAAADSTAIDAAAICQLPPDASWMGTISPAVTVDPAASPET